MLLKIALFIINNAIFIYDYLCNVNVIIIVLLSIKIGVITIRSLENAGGTDRCLY